METPERGHLFRFTLFASSLFTRERERDLAVTLTAFVIIEFCNNLFKLGPQPGKYLQEIASDYESSSHTHTHTLGDTKALSHTLTPFKTLLHSLSTFIDFPLRRPCLLFAVKKKTKVVHACVRERESCFVGSTQTRPLCNSICWKL